MRRFYLLLAGLFLFGMSAFSQITYVKTGASGANTGASWADAYPDLSTALANTATGEIWVAGGVYKPGTDTLSRFEIGNAVAIYGGFAGTETMLDQRDPAANPTILDGDVNGDDTAGDFDNNKSDNVFHVVYVDSLIADPVILDGFTIRNGRVYAESDTLDAYFSQGAGLWAFSTVDVRNTTFTQNIGGAGAAAVILGENAAGSSFDNVVFDANQAYSNAVLLAVLTSDLSLNNTGFTNNLTENGSFQTLFSANISIDNSHFTNNQDTVTGGFSSGLFLWQSINLTVSNTEFTGNSATSAPAVYIDGRDIQADGLGGYDFNNVTFADNTIAGGRGTAYFFQANDVNFKHAEFNGNLSPGGFATGIYSRGDSLVLQDAANFTIDSSMFVNNDTDNRGGGIYFHSSSARVTETTFDGNNADVIGGGIYLVDVTGAPATFLEIENCNFTGNTSAFGGGIGHQSDFSTLTLKGSNFENNMVSSSGAAAYLGPGVEAPMTIENTTFVNNNANAGAGFIYFTDYSDLTVNSSVFENNTTANDGGGMYISSVGANIMIDDTQFSNNSSAGYGGGAIMLFADSSDVNITNSDFTENIGSTGGGGAIYFGSQDGFLTVENTAFTGNANSFGGGIANFGTGSLATYKNCEFRENQGITSGGGAMTNGFGVTLDVQNSVFEANTGTVGAAVRVQNDDIVTSYKGSTFDGNIASSGGGALFVFGTNPTTIDSCSFLNNQGPTGGAVYLANDTNLVVLSEISNSVFRLNTAGSQGGAINHGNVNMNINNCLFTGNAASDTGTGGALSINSSDTSDVVVNILNSTFSENLGALAGHFSVWTDPTEPGFSNATVNLANNIFYSLGDKNYAIEDGTPVVLSLGGNMSLDPESTLDVYLTEATDKPGEDPLFVDPTGFLDPDGIPNLHLTAESPAIDAALPEYATAFDLDGNPRPFGAAPDMGAYEFTIVRAEEVVPNEGLLTIAPNPVKDAAVLKLKGAWEGALTIRIADQNGRVLRQIAARKTGEQLTEQVDVTGLPAGAYQVMVTDGRKMVVTAMIKQ
ncbi:MAG: T9SS type A sorting domain-containing protein [Lewinella sp.]|nr:T9SS type A sorting domain-containing protein [Lewinella sp.]